MVIWLFITATVIVGVSGAAGLAFGRRSAMGQRLAASLNVLGALAAAVALVWLRVDSSSAPSVVAPWGLPIGRFAVAVDAIGAVFLIPMFLVSALGAIYGLGYWRQREHPANGRQLGLCWGLMTAGMVTVVLARDAVLLLMGWEVMAIAAFFLVATEDADAEVRKAAWVYLVATHVGTLCLFGFFALLHRATGSFALWPTLPSNLPAPLATGLFVLGTVGFGLKAGIMPLHVWLPGAHANAPSHVSAIMSGVLLKAGVYGVVRVTALLPHPPAWWGGTLLVAGTLSAVLGIAFANGQRDLKRLLAYSSIENVGIITLGIGLAALGRALNRSDWIVLGLGGALLHVLNHSLFKPLLFLGAGGIVHAAHTRVMDLMGGLGKSMPRTLVLVTLGALAICGLPPLNGFVSELLIYLGLFRTMEGGPPQYGWTALAAPALALVGAMAVAAFVKVLGTIFAGDPRTPAASHGRDPVTLMLVPMVILAAGCLLIGLWPSAALGLLNDAVRQWAAGGQPTAPLQDYVALRWVSFLGIALIVLCAALGVWLMRRRGRAQTRSGLTWDCGYARPTARIQYSGSSFSQMLVDLLAWVLWPRTRAPRLRGAFPSAAAFASEVPDVVLDRTLLPAMVAADGALARARVIQRGTVQVYLLYMLGILIVLLLLG